MQSNIKIIDAGHATRLSNYVGEVDGNPLWTSKFIIENPNAIVQSHLDFLNAGSEIIQTFTYQATINGFIKNYNVTEKQALEFIELGGKLAMKAKDLYMKEHPGSNIEVFGSIGPYGVLFCDGSEYTGCYTDQVSIKEIKDFQRPRIEALLKAQITNFSFETVPSKKEAEAVVELLNEFPQIRAWISFYCKDNKHTAYGDNFKETAISIYSQNPNQIVAVGVNCLDPQYVSDLFKDINNDKGQQNFIPLIAYPNKGDTFIPGKGYVEQDDVPPLHTWIKEWIDLGARYIGGCCTTSVNDIPLWKNEVDKIKNLK